MKILVVSQHYKPEPFNVHETCEELVRRGHEVTVLTALPNYPGGEILEGYRCGAHRDEVVDGVRVIRAPIIPRGKDLKGLRKVQRAANYFSFPIAAWLTKAASGVEFDCVMCFQFSPVLMALPALRIARRLGVPCLVWAFDLWPEDMLTGGLSRDGLPYKIMRRVSRRIYGAASEVAVTSPGFTTYFSEQLGLNSLKTTWLPQFAEESFERIGNEDNTSDSGRGETVFTFAGNIAGNQSVETIVRAAALLGDKPIRVRVAGSGSRLEACKGLAREIGASDVEFLGRLPIDDMPALYASSDAMLLTLAKPGDGSLVPVYTIPRKFQSYLAAGKPVVCSVDGIVGEIVDEEGCGISCAAEDPHALAGAMERFASCDSKQRLAYANRAKDFYARRFSRARFFEQLEEMLDELVAKGR